MRRKDNSGHDSSAPVTPPVPPARRRTRNGKGNKWGTASLAISVSVFLLLCVCMLQIMQEKSDRSESDKESDSSTPESEAADRSYEEATTRKLAATIKDGWFTANSSQILTFGPSKDIKSLVQQMAAQNWPSKASVSEVADLFPVLNWDLAMYSHSSVVLPGCRMQQNEPVFVLGSERDKGGMLGSAHDRPLSYINTTVEDFLQTTFRPDVWLYWTGELSYIEESLGLQSKKRSLSGKQKQQDTSPWSDFHVDESQIHVEQDNDDDSSPVRPMAWFSHPGVVAQTHYDTQHNLFLQAQGLKRVHLFPPATDLHLYPHIHRSFRQSQVHVEHPYWLDNREEPTKEAQRFSRVSASSGVEAIEVLLQPGDLLYIPPYWQHRVESLTLSLSISVLSPSRLEAGLAEIAWTKVPLGRADLRQSRSLRVRAVMSFLDHVIQRSLFRQDTWQDGEEASLPSRDFVAQIFHSRFAPLSPQTSFLSSTKPLCPLPANATEDDIIASLQPEFVSVSRTIAQQFLDLAPPAGVAEMFLGDYVEQLVRWAVGPQLTANVLRHCF